MRASFATIAMMVALLASLAEADVVERRGAEPVIQGKVIKVDEAGVTIDRSLAEADFIRWDRIRRVESVQYSREIKEFQDLADQLWRARSRVERGDTVLAEPILERLFERYRGQKHETALVVAEGLLRCRLARGANEEALIPALETARLRRAALGKDPVYAGLPGVIDQRTSLCMLLPPAFASTANMTRVERELAVYDARDDVVIAAQAVLYRQALRQHMGIAPAQDDRKLAADHPGPMVLGDLIALTGADGSRRNQVRQQLVSVLPTLEPWLQAWTHFAIGLSLLAESGEGRRQEGLVHLSHLPARFAGEQRYLAGLALARMAANLETNGDQASASALREELHTNYPNHPAITKTRTRSGGKDQNKT